MNNQGPRVQKRGLFRSLAESACYLILFFSWQTVVMSGYLSILMASGATAGMDMVEMYDLLYAKAFDLTTVANLLTILTVVIMIKVRRKSLREELWIRPVPGKLLGWCAALAFCFYWLVTLVLSFLPEFMMAGYDEASSALYETGFLTVIGTALISPVVEEIIFRGLIYTRLQRAMRPAVAVALSSLVFAFCHGQIVWMCYAFVLGMVFGQVTRFSRSLLPALVMHLVFNATNEVLVLLGDWQPGTVGFVVIAVVGVGGTALCGRKVWSLARAEAEKARQAEAEAEVEVCAEPLHVCVEEEPVPPAKAPPAMWDSDSGSNHRFPPECM